MTRLAELLEDFYVEDVPGVVTALNPCGKFLAQAGTNLAAGEPNERYQD
jgi:hypothetical protein